MVDTDDTRRTIDDRRWTTPGVWHKLPTGELKMLSAVTEDQVRTKGIQPLVTDLSLGRIKERQLKLACPVTGCLKQSGNFLWKNKVLRFVKPQDIEFLSVTDYNTSFRIVL